MIFAVYMSILHIEPVHRSTVKIVCAIKMHLSIIINHQNKIHRYGHENERTEAWPDRLLLYKNSNYVFIYRKCVGSRTPLENRTPSVICRYKSNIKKSLVSHGSSRKSNLFCVEWSKRWWISGSVAMVTAWSVNVILALDFFSSNWRVFHLTFSVH